MLINPWTLFCYLVIGLYVGMATIGVFIIWYTHGSFLDIDFSGVGHTLVTFSQLANWGQCSSWENFTVSPFTAGNHLSLNDLVLRVVQYCCVLTKVYFITQLSLLLRGTVVAPLDKLGEALQDERINGGAFIGTDGLQLPHKLIPTRNAIGLVAPAIAAGLSALTHTLGTLVPVIGASAFATDAAATTIGTAVDSFR